MDVVGAPMIPHANGREGAALAMVVLSLLVLAGIASAAVAAAVGQVRSAAAAGQLLAARAAARAGMEATLAGTTGASAASEGGAAVELASGDFGEAGTWRVLAVRITSEHHLFLGEAAMEAGAAFRELRPTWWLDPETRVAGHRAVVEGAAIQVGAGAQVLANRILEARPGMQACGSRTVLADAFAGAVVPLTGPLPSPEWDATPADSANGAGAEARIGLLRGAMLSRAADARLPLEPSCADCWHGLVTGSGSVEVTGSGRGVLVVRGSVALVPGSSWTGLVVASGDVEVQGSATVTGLVRGGGSVTLAAGAVVDGSACVAVRALESARSLARPIPISGSSWASAFVSAGA